MPHHFWGGSQWFKHWCAEWDVSFVLPPFGNDTANAHRLSKCKPNKNLILPNENSWNLTSKSIKFWWKFWSNCEPFLSQFGSECFQNNHSTQAKMRRLWNIPPHMLTDVDWVTIYLASLRTVNTWQFYNNMSCLKKLGLQDISNQPFLFLAKLDPRDFLNFNCIRNDLFHNHLFDISFGKRLGKILICM